MLKNKYMKLFGIGSLCLFLLGCSEESFLISQEKSSTIVLEEVVAKGELAHEAEKVSLPEENSRQEEAQLEVLTSDKEIAVHICGAVNRPGVYYLKEKQRIHEGIQKAGGFREDADSDYLNQALFLEDGMKIVVPTKEETKEMKVLEEKEATQKFIQGATVSEKEDEKTKKVDLNTADEALLCTLPGIGESRAKSIIAYRTEHGAFQKTEDIMKVSGIKEAAYEKIKEYVTVTW